MLWFKSIEDYTKAANSLFNLQNDDIMQFNELYVEYNYDEIESMNELDQDILSESIEAIESKISFSENGIYEQFESKLNFNSLREEINQLEEVFYSNTNPNWDEEPDNHFIAWDAERTILNKYSEVRIGDELFVFGDGICLKINDGDYKTLISLRKNLNIYTTFENVSSF